MVSNEVIYCMIRQGHGPVSVTLRADNALATGIRFALLECDRKTQRETWDLTAGASGQETHPIRASIDTLGGNCLSWSMVVCAVHAAAHTGTVEIELAQDGVACPLTTNLEWSLKDVPPCAFAGDSVVRIQHSLTFVTRSLPGQR